MADSRPLILGDPGTGGEGIMSARAVEETLARQAKTRTYGKREYSTRAQFQKNKRGGIDGGWGSVRALAAGW